MATTEQILTEIRNKKISALGTNINNINNNQLLNNSITSQLVPGGSEQVEKQDLVLPVGRASPDDSIHFSGGSELPPTWRGIKWDLFGRQPKLGIGYKLKMSVIRQDRQSLGFTASLNSPHNRMWRGIENNQTAHWIVVREQYELYRKMFGLDMNKWRVSKFYQNAKQASVDQMAVFMHFDVDNYCIRFIYDTKIYDYLIARNSFEKLSENQHRRYQLATAYFGGSTVRMINPKDLGL